LTNQQTTASRTGKQQGKGHSKFVFMDTYPLIDCDVHQPSPTKEQLVEYLDEPYRTEIARYGTRKIASGIRGEEGGNRRDLDAGALGDPNYFATALLNRYRH